MSRRRHLLLVATAVLALVAPPAGATTETRCTFEGPVPGYRALRVDLPQGSDFLVLELDGQRNPRAFNDDTSWHLAEGILVIDADTRAIVAHQVLNVGTSPPVVVAEAEGAPTVRQGAAGPDGPWVHSARKARADLPPGTYYVVAFGIGGPTGGALAQRWGASLYVEGTHSCASAAAGEIFDYDHTDFSSGTQVHVPGAGYAENVRMAFDNDRPLAVGLMDAGFQGEGAGSVALDYDFPAADGQLGRRIVPFVSQAGRHAFSASYQGVHPIVAVSGVTLNVPGGAQ